MIPKSSESCRTDTRHTPFVPPKWNLHCWKVLQTAYRTSDRINIPLLCKYCSNSDTLMHRYFLCNAVQPIWNSLNKIFPSSYSTQNENINWFYQISYSFVDQDLRVIMFITALWSIHTAFLENTNSNQVYQALPLLRMATNVAITFENILFGKNWPTPLQNKIKSWPQPWFLLIFQNTRSVQYCPRPPPSILDLDLPDPTDHPPDN